MNVNIPGERQPCLFSRACSVRAPLCHLEYLCRVDGGGTSVGVADDHGGANAMVRRGVITGWWNTRGSAESSDGDRCVAACNRGDWRMSCGVLTRSELALGARGHVLSGAKERVDVLAVAWGTRRVGRQASRLCGGSQQATVFRSLGIQWRRGGVVKPLSKPFAVWWQAFSSWECICFDPSICPMTAASRRRCPVGG